MLIQIYFLLIIEDILLCKLNLWFYEVLVFSLNLFIFFAVVSNNLLNVEQSVKEKQNSRLV